MSLYPLVLPCALAACCFGQTDMAVADPAGDRFWLSGQANFIRQQHGDFFAAYSGPNSLPNAAEHATSRVLTLYTGARITKRLEVLFDVESAGGAGIGQ